MSGEYSTISNGGTMEADGDPVIRRADLGWHIRRPSRMVDRPETFSPDDVLAELLKAALRAFDIAGIGEEETERGDLYRAIVGYVEPVSARIEQKLEDDPVSQFLRECTVSGAGQIVSTAVLMKAYSAWAEKYSMPALTPQNLARAMRAKGFETLRRIYQQREWQGLCLIPFAQPSVPSEPRRDYGSGCDEFPRLGR